jgi:hypothetical protein
MTVTADLAIVPANEASWADLQAVFGLRGTSAVCWCQRYKLRPKESFGRVPARDRATRLREQTHCGDATASTTTGLVAYLDGEPVGWCAVEPRPAYFGLLRVYRVPWEGRFGGQVGRQRLVGHLRPRAGRLPSPRDQS